ncbi:uncharacterized protein LOC121384701 [Gigantopelta aegis]|uniref:uncharacterized protein LOC121384701 n=1 Tax=Gigantopelta aegis TaxID=1735272 RepID=UPI001B88AC78|nr:uncharacterized protein LOC121384701 [Gigantopelta aegis]XP_041371138.1 uncharacterized protein LOC121384701 [Gigantopelta aegis]
MGTLFECLREARLEKYYPAFRANGIIRSEMLSRLTLDDCMALGITSLDDKRRVIELINIIKSVHSASRSHVSATSRLRSDNPSTSSAARRNVEPRQRNTSPSQHTQSSGGSSRPLEVTRDVVVNDRTPHFSATSYIDLLQLLSESSDSASSDDSVHSGYKPTRKNTNRSNISMPPVRVKRAAVQRIKHDRGYNYGVPQATSKGKSNCGTAKSSSDDRIRVCVRKRPLTRKEVKGHDPDIVEADDATVVIVNEPKQAVDLTAFTLQHEFVFDEVFGETCTNEDVYLRAARPLINCLFNGSNATCFAYGQTGAGKTYTMMGSAEIPGLYLLAARDIFSIMLSGQYGTELCLWVSFFEIYCGQLFDLLNRRQRLHAREDGSQRVCIAGLMETKAKDVAGLIEVLDYGNSVRSKGATGVNPDSSRSHAILQMEIRDTSDRKLGRISFIDLAGSERAADVTDTDRQTRMEGAEINQSLLALKECIRSIDQESRHKPFRQSKLTHILKDSFIGNSRMCMIANISPTYVACENTLNTLRYADRVKELKRHTSSKGPTTRQAMNLLMNIPITAPSIFHPSSVPSTSTPMRPSARSNTTRQHTFEDSLLEQSTSPVRGHNVRRKTARSQPQQTTFHVSPPRTVTPARTKSASSSSHSVPQDVSVPVRKTPVSKANITAAPVTAHQVSSPSGSDRTDSESCNLTLPKNAPNPVESAPVTAVSAPSTDSEFDFPTSDFNEAEGLNDLNKSDPPRTTAQTTMSTPVGQGYTNAAVPRSDLSGMVVTEPSQRIQQGIHGASIQDGLVLKPFESDCSRTGSNNQKEVVPAMKKPKRSNSPGRRLPSLHLVQAGVAGIPAESVPSQVSSTPYAIPQTEATPLAGSVDDDMLFDAPPPSRAPGLGGTIATTLEERNHLGIIPAALPASSSDLTQFTQRPRVAPPTDMEGILLTPRQAEVIVPNVAGDAAATTASSSSAVATEISASLAVSQYGGIYTSAHSSHARPTVEFYLSPSTVLTESLPMVDILPELPAELVTPSPVEDRRGTESKTPSPIHQSLSKDGRPCRQRHTSASSPAESSDDSFEAVRTSVSDSGQGPYKVSTQVNRVDLHKGKSDPILALHMQKKKHTLPDPQEFLKYLSRGATPKSGSSPSISSPMSGILTKPDSQSEMGSHLSPNKTEPFEPLAHDQEKEKPVDYNVPPGLHTGAPDRNTQYYGNRQFSGGDTVMADISETRSVPHTQSVSHVKTKSGMTVAAMIDRSQADARRFARSPTMSDQSRRHSQANNNSVFVQKDKPNILVVPNEMGNVKDAALAVDSEMALKNVHVTVSSYVVRNNNSPYGGKSTNAAIVTEKLATGSVFSPIHPQPLTSAVVSKTVASSLDVIQPKPVHTTASLSLTGRQERTVRKASLEEKPDYRSELISAHEDQLATVTSLCKQEMKLLLGAKAGNRSFEEYLKRVNDLLSQKLLVMQRLQTQITSYCEEKGIPAFSANISQSSSGRTSISQSASRSSSIDQLTSRSVNVSHSALSQRAQR